MIPVFLTLLGGYFVIGLIAAIAENRKNRSKSDEPRVVVMQRVPSVFELFKRGR